MPSFLAKACYYWPFYLRFGFIFVGLFELRVSKKYNTLLAKSIDPRTEDGPVAVGGFLFKYRGIGGYKKAASAGKAFQERSTCFGRLMSCLQASTGPESV